MDLLSNLECPEQPDAPEHRHSHGRHVFQVHHHKLDDGRCHHEEVEFIEEGSHVGLHSAQSSGWIQGFKREYQLLTVNPRAYIFKTISPVKRMPKVTFV